MARTDTDTLSVERVALSSLSQHIAHTVAALGKLDTSEALGAVYQSLIMLADQATDEEQDTRLRRAAQAVRDAVWPRPNPFAKSMEALRAMRKD